MLKTISDQSQFAYSSELSWFSTPPTAVGIHQIRFREIPLEHGLNNEGPYIFHLVKQHHFINLARSYIAIECKILDKDGKAYSAGADAKGAYSRCAPIQYFARTFWKQAVVLINGIQVEDTGACLPWRTFINTEFMNDADTKHYQFGGPTLGAHNDNGYESPVNSGYAARAKRCDDGSTLQLYSTLDLGLATSNRLLLNNLDFTLQLFRSPDSLVLNDFDGSQSRGWKVEIESLKFVVCEYLLYNSTILALENALAAGQLATYPVRHHITKNFFVPANTTQTQEYTCFTMSQIPRRMYICLVHADAFHGDYIRDPFYMNHYDLRNIFIDFGGKSVPLRGFNLDYDNNRYTAAFVQMQEGLGFSGSSRTNGIDMNMFKTSRCLYVLDLLPGHDFESAFDVAMQGATTLRLEFKQATGQGLQCIVMGEFMSLVTMDKLRQCTVLPT